MFIWQLHFSNLKTMNMMKSIQVIALMIVLLFFSLPMQAQQVTITGKVTDLENGEPLPGVNILAKGTTTGTVTDVDGNYQLSVGSDVTTLVFSSIGYTTEEVEINGRSTINLTMAPDIQSLSEVVVVGYGTQLKKDLTGSVASISTEDLEKSPAITTVTDAMQGRVAGVQVTQASAAPGGGDECADSGEWIHQCIQ